MLRRLVLALLPGLLALAALPALAQSNDPSFRVVNNTANVVNEVYASPSSQRNWGRDRLGDSIIRPGANTIIRLPADGNCVYDIRIVYQGGGAEERRNLNTCNITDLVLGERGAAAPRQDQRQGQGPGQGSGQAQGNPSFNLVNQSSRVVESLFASPSSQQSWGRDRLGDDLVQPGQTYAIRLPLGECVYDIRIVWTGGQSQERRNVNVCNIVNYVLR
jgi:hypothetical protein